MYRQPILQVVPEYSVGTPLIEWQAHLPVIGLSDSGNMEFLGRFVNLLNKPPLLNNDGVHVSHLLYVFVQRLLLSDHDYFCVLADFIEYSKGNCALLPR